MRRMGGTKDISGTWEVQWKVSGSVNTPLLFTALLTL